MGNKVKYNLKNVHVAKLSKDEEGNLVYTTPVAIPGAVSISLDAEGDSSPFYADGIVYFHFALQQPYQDFIEQNLKEIYLRTFLK